MADDTADLDLNDIPELETASPEIGNHEEEAIDLDLDLEAEGQEGEEGEGIEPEDEFEDVEFDGKTHKLPKGIKEALLRQEDYTRKTQTVAEERRALEQQRERIAQQALASEAELDARVAIKAIDKRIAEYSNVDWQAWNQQDPSAAQAGMMELNQLREQRSKGAGFIQQSEQKRIADAHQEFGQRIAETKSFAAKEIKGWTPDLDAKITNFALSDLGIAPQYLQENINPLLYRVLHRAYVGEQAMKRAASVKATPTAATAVPLTTVKAKTSVRGSSDLASAGMDAYVEARKRGVGGKSPLRG